MSIFGKGEPPPSVALNLTALMDILSNLLFFLLASYSSQAAEVSQAIHLPSSSSEVQLHPSLTITISKKDIELAGVPVAELENNQIKGLGPDVDRIASLYDKMRSVKASRAAAGRDETGPESEMVLLMADRDTDSSIITKVLKTSGSAGFVNIRFGVTSQ
jgi:biopolymer transport protein ExbD